MRTQIIAKAFGTLLAAVFLAAAVGACPAGSIAGAGDLIMAPLGPIIVESCVSEDGDLSIYTYEITNAGRGPIELCRFTVPGLGIFSTIGSSEPLGLTLTIEEASGCATWWIWEGASAEILPGETVTLSIFLNTETTATMRDAYLALCDGTKESAQVLAPSACAGITDDSHAGCFCGDGTTPCEATVSFEGEGTRINMLGGLDRQVLAVCDASWVAHGFSGLTEEELEHYDFRLDIDGVDVSPSISVPSASRETFRTVDTCPRSGSSSSRPTTSKQGACTNSSRAGSTTTDPRATGRSSHAGSRSRFSRV